MTRCGFPLAVSAAPAPNLSMHGEVSAQLSGASHQPAGMGDREKDCHLQWNESLGLFPRPAVPSPRRGGGRPVVKPDMGGLIK